MASRAIQSLLASRYEKSRPHRAVVRVGAVVAWAVAVAYVAMALITSDGNYLITAVGPVLAASLMTTQVVVRREHGGFALFGSGLIASVWTAVFGHPVTMVPAAVAIVLVASLGMLFLGRHRTAVMSGIAVTLFFLPRFWDLDGYADITLGLIVAFCFVLTSVVLISIQDSAKALNDRYQMLFEESPTAMLEEDWSESIAHVRSEFSGNPARIRQFLQAYPEVVREAVGHSKTIRANDAALALLDASSASRLLGYRDSELVTDENLDLFISALVSLYEDAKGWEGEVPVRTKAGNHRWLQFRSVDVSAGAQATSVIIGLADITHVRAEQDAMAEVMRAKDDFIANVSHELRTPLTAVIGLSAELSKTDGLSEAERSELLQLVTDQAAEMSNIVEDLLVAARAEVGTISVEPQAVDLLVELGSTLEGLGIDVGVPTESAPPVLADPRRVRQILRNLLTNAQRHGGAHCRVVVGTLRHRAWLEVRDDGDGVPEGDAHRIFEAYMTSGGRESVGLGLAVARQLAELMGGTLEYERSAGESVFRLELPLDESRAPALASHGDQA